MRLIRLVGVLWVLLVRNSLLAPSRLKRPTSSHPHRRDPLQARGLKRPRHYPGRWDSDFVVVARIDREKYRL